MKYILRKKSLSFFPLPARKVEICSHLIALCVKQNGQSNGRIAPAHESFSGLQSEIVSFKRFQN